jgi:hypothetical protein
MTLKSGDIQGAELLTLHNQYVEQGLKRVEIAKKIGLPYSTYLARLQYARERVQIPPSRYPKYDKAPVITGDVIIMGDLHIPYHHSEFVNRCLQLCLKWGVGTAILAGDAIDAHSFSHWGSDVGTGIENTLSANAEKALLDEIEKLPAAQQNQMRELIAGMTREPDDISTELAESRIVLRQLAAAFQRVLWFTGNHESRVVRKIEKALTGAEISTLFGAGGDKWTFSGYYYALVHSGGTQYRVTHPKNSGKGSSKKLAGKYQSHVVMLHNHALSLQADPSGRYLGIEPGMCADLERIDYSAQRDSTGDMPINGALIIRGGYPYLLNPFTDFDFLGQLSN